MTCLDASHRLQPICLDEGESLPSLTQLMHAVTIGGPGRIWTAARALRTAVHWIQKARCRSTAAMTAGGLPVAWRPRDNRRTSHCDGADAVDDVNEAPGNSHAPWRLEGEERLTRSRPPPREYTPCRCRGHSASLTARAAHEVKRGEGGSTEGRSSEMGGQYAGKNLGNVLEVAGGGELNRGRQGV
uniref:Uncharacterized protein n=1 Tax=Oryza meridionalis TaxID=40149 RepID=A0A0E0ERS4_9ORYZ